MEKPAFFHDISVLFLRFSAKIPRLAPERSPDDAHILFPAVPSEAAPLFPWQRAFAPPRTTLS
ncbi:MAG: hypothetical protein IJE98_00035, partial [Oscillospiraceae bacterium]|nr:hypothetical protein [Oscillospiraceae bacterium]